MLQIFANMDWDKVASTYGVPTVLLLLLCLGMWKSWVWFRVKIAEPLVNAHTQFVRTTAETNTANMGELRKQTQLLDGIRQELPNICKADCAEQCENFAPKRPSKPPHCPQGD